jgi:hypothetical protein
VCLSAQGRFVGYRYRNRVITVEGPACASELLIQIGDAVRFECYRNLLLADMLLDYAETDGDFPTCHKVDSTQGGGEYHVLDADPALDPTEGLSTVEVSALREADPTSGGAACFAGLLVQNSLGHTVCGWQLPAPF